MGEGLRTSLQGHAATAWDALVQSLSRARNLSGADLLKIEAAAKAWGRWRDLEDQIERLGAQSNLGGEFTKGPTGGLQASTLRTSASTALSDFERLLAGIMGGDAPADGLPDRDLFGYPDRPGRGQRGRPRFVPTIRDRNRVRLLLALGWSNDRIAAALEISPPTLRRYFKVELAERDAMRDRLDARRLELAMQEANDGNVSALRELGRLIEKQDILLAERRFIPAEEDAAPVGKKEQARLDAKKALEDPDLKPGIH